MSITSAQAVTLLENVLFESATNAQAHAAQWVSISQADTASTVVSDIATAMAGTAETGIAEQVVRYYEGALGREPTIQEVAYYVKIAEAGLSANQIAQGPGAVAQATWNQIADYFAASPEFHTLYGGSDSAVVSALYQNILGRAPSAEETSYYQKVLDGGTSVSTLVQYFVTSPEYQDKSDAAILAKLAGTGVAAVNYYSGSTGTSTSVGSSTSALTITETTSLINVGIPGGVSVVATLPGMSTTPGTITVDALDPTFHTLVMTVGGSTIQTVVLDEGASAESLHFTAVSGTGTDLVYSSDGTTHTLAVTAGLTFEIPAGTGSIELTGVQPGLSFTLTHA